MSVSERRVALWLIAGLGVAASTFAAGSSTLYMYDNNGNLHVVTDTGTDPQNCGGAGVRCSSTAPHTIPACSASQCTFACATGWSNCDNDLAANGCERSITTVDDCGACGNTCPIPANSNPTCSKSCDAVTCQQLCGIACMPDYTNCGGRCVLLSETATDCGSCGHSCPGIDGGYATCANGACGLACDSSNALCPGVAGGSVCVDVNANPASCGVCAGSCGANECAVAPWNMVRVDVADGKLVAHRLQDCSALSGLQWPDERTGGGPGSIVSSECVVPPWNIDRIDIRDDALVTQRLPDCTLVSGLVWPPGPICSGGYCL